MKLRAKNFQPIIDGVIEVVGITFLTGLNNQGKSSWIRSFNALISGRSGDDHVRKGATTAMVGAELREGPDHPETQLAWIKGSGGSEYYIDGVKFSKLGRRGVPTEDLVKHGFREIEVGGVRHYLNFALQDDPHFLVSLPPTQVFDYVSKVLQEREILPVIKVMAEDAKEMTQEAKLLEGQILTRKQSVKEWSEQREGLQAALQRTNDFVSLQKSLTSLRRMCGARDEMVEIRGVVRELEGKISEKDDFLSEVTPRVEGYEKESTHLEGLKFFKRKLEVVEFEMQSYQEDLETLQSFLDNAPDIEMAEGISRSLKEEKALLEKMTLSRRAYVKAGQDLELVESEIEDAEKALVDAEVGFDEVKSEIGVCPVCGSEIGGCDE